jgi:hypothetical protein
MPRKLYKARSISGAQSYVRLLLKQRDELDGTLGRYMHELSLLARLSAKGPAFDNPLVIAAAEKIRDRELKTMGMNPDGSYIKQDPPDAP